MWILDTSILEAYHFLLAHRVLQETVCRLDDGAVMMLMVVQVHN